MKPRKLSAHYLLPGHGNLLRKGILEIDAEGKIAGVRDTGGLLTEEAGLEFYNGILLPEFVNPCRTSSPHNAPFPRVTPEFFTANRESFHLWCPTAYLRYHRVPVPFHQLKPCLSQLCIGSDEQNPVPHQAMLNELLCLQNLYPELNLPLLARLATLNSALALGIDREYGSFEKGKLPGVLLIENADLPNLKLRADSRAINLLPGLRP
jgi:hypothetical protein